VWEVNYLIELRVRERITELEDSKVLRQMFEGIAYMHSKNVAHCDLKPDNFLFLTTAKDSPLKIIDFGMSKFVQRRKYFETLCGTPYYVAPEVISGKYSEHCDMWSLGVVMFVMLFGYPPFYADQEVHGPYTDERIFALVKKGFEPVTKDGYGPHFPKSIPISDSAKDLISKLLTLDISKRFSAAEALEHPWLLGTSAESKPLVQNVMQNLSNFSANFKFKQSILMLMSDSLSDTELSSLKTTFRQIDKNDDGKITVAEMKEAMEKYGSSSESKSTGMSDVAAMMKAADVDGDGTLSYNELLMTAVQRKLLAKEERLWDAFRKLDLNGDGKITKDEIKKVLGEEAANELIAAADTNGDGDIDYDEFITVWSNNHPDSKDDKKADKKDEKKDEKDEKKDEKKDAKKEESKEENKDGKKDDKKDEKKDAKKDDKDPKKDDKTVEKDEKKDDKKGDKKDESGKGQEESDTAKEAKVK